VQTEGLQQFNWSRHRWWLLGLFLAVMVLYSRTLSVPWYFDDFSAIVNNSSLRDTGAKLAGFFTPRGPVDVTFALNFQLHGLQVAGYHLVNIAIHLANAFLFFLLLGRIFRENRLQQYAATMIFLLHPIQTQTVNYIVQRYTLAAAFCGLLSLFLIVRWGERRDVSCRTPASVATYLAALFFGALAVMCKQNMAPLALIVPLFCYYFVARQWSKKELFLYLVLPFAVMPVWEGVRQFVYPLVTGASLGELTGVLPSPDYPTVSPLLYFATQWKVVLIYLRLFVLPYGQALDYGYPVTTSVITILNMAALAGLSAFVGVAVMVRNSFPRISFGIAWFFIFLLVESTFIPLDPLFEHRLYLPLAGLAIIAADVLGKLPGKKAAGTTIALIAMTLGILTWNRNELWLSPADLLVDNVKKRPDNARIYAGAANALAETGDTREGRRLLLQGFQRGLRHVAMYLSLINILITEGDLPDAVLIGEEGLHFYPESADILYKTGLAEDLRGNHTMAEDHFRRAIELYPEREQGYSNYGTSMYTQRRWEEAAAAFRKALEINPLYPIAHLNLGSVLHILNRPVEAAEEFRLAYQLGGDVRALESLVAIKAEAGDWGSAESLLKELESIDPARGAALRQQMVR
jgi:protein O-mannosyl-transferase